MKSTLFYFMTLCPLLMGCSGEDQNKRHNMHKAIYVETVNLRGDYKACYEGNLLKLWEKSEIGEIIKGNGENPQNIQSLYFYEINKLNKKQEKGFEKITFTVQDSLNTEGVVYFIEHFIQQKDKWVSKGVRQKFKVTKIHPEDKSPYGLDVDEVCEQLLYNTIKTALQ